MAVWMRETQQTLAEAAAFGILVAPRGLAEIVAQLPPEVKITTHNVLWTLENTLSDLYKSSDGANAIKSYLFPILQRLPSPSASRDSTAATESGLLFVEVEELAYFSANDAGRYFALPRFLRRLAEDQRCTTLGCVRSGRLINCEGNPYFPRTVTWPG